MESIVSALLESPSLQTLERLYLSGNCLDELVGQKLAVLLDQAPKFQWLNIQGQKGEHKIGIQCKANNLFMSRAFQRSGQIRVYIQGTDETRSETETGKLNFPTIRQD